MIVVFCIFVPEQMGDERGSPMLQGEISQKSEREQDLPALSKK
jgi:hypothetical protein